jgi:hypothetical protein
MWVMSKQNLKQIAAYAAMCFGVYALTGVNLAAAAPPSIFPPVSDCLFGQVF